MVRGIPISQVSVELIELFLKAGAEADDELTHKVRIFRKCFIFLPWTILRFALSCTSRLVGTASSGSFVIWRCLSSSIHWWSLWWLSMESGSILIVIFHLRSMLLSTQSCLILSCQCATNLPVSTDFTSNCQLYLLWKLFLFDLLDNIINPVDVESSCGLWILFHFKLNVHGDCCGWCWWEFQSSRNDENVCLSLWK